MAPEPLKGGYDVDDSAVRFSNYLHVLREIVHLTSGHLALEPRLEVKALLGDHLYDDARAVTKLRRRLYELRAPNEYPGAPSEDAGGAARPRQRGRHAGVPRDRLRRAQADADRRLPDPPRQPGPGHRRAQPAAAHPAPAPPGPPRRRAAGGPRARRVRGPRRAPRRAARGAPAEGAAAARAAGARRLRRGGRRRRPLYANGDETHVPTEGEEQKRFFHGLMDAELCAAELMARNSHEHPEMPWDFHVDMARQVWDEIRHAEIHDRLMATELGCHWGDYPVGFGYFRSIYALDLLGRLALLNGASEEQAISRHSHRRKVLIDRPDHGRARLRLPARRRAPARARRRPLGQPPPGGRRARVPREGARAAPGPRQPLERHLRAPAAARAAALRHRLLRGRERLAEPAAERSGRLAGATAADAEHLLAAALRMTRQARSKEREDQQQDAETDN